MALIFLGLNIVFTVSSFEFQQVRLPWLLHQWFVSGSNSLDLSPLNYRVWVNAGVLSQAAFLVDILNIIML